MKNITRYSGAFVFFIFILASIPFGAFSRQDDRVGIEDRQIRGQRGSVEEYVTDELIVKYKGDREPFRVEKLSAGKSPKDAAREFGARPDVEYAEPNYLAYAFMESQRVYLFPWLMLRRAWGNYKTAWINKYKPPIIAQNRGYQTISVAVPIMILKKAISTATTIQL